MNRINEAFGFVKNGLDKVKSVSYEKFQMNLDKMEELAGYYAMKYSLNYDTKLMPLRDIVYEGKMEEDNYYDILHKQNTVEYYCQALKKILWKMSLDDIMKGYQELEKNPEEDLVKIMHKVFGSNCKNKYTDAQTSKGDEEQDEILYETKEENYQSHR